MNFQKELINAIRRAVLPSTAAALPSVRMLLSHLSFITDVEVMSQLMLPLCCEWFRFFSVSGQGIYCPSLHAAAPSSHTALADAILTHLFAEFTSESSWPQCCRVPPGLLTCVRVSHVLAVPLAVRFVGFQSAHDLFCVHYARGELKVCSRGQTFSIFDFPKQLSTCLSLQATLSVFQASAV